MAFCLFEIHARFVFTLVIRFTWFIWFRVWTNKKKKNVVQAQQSFYSTSLTDQNMVAAKSNGFRMVLED